MKTQAAILVELGKPLELVDLEIPPLKPGQVLVELQYSGVCHTQVGEWQGWRGPDPYLPHCLGHEGCARVLEVGPGVTRCGVEDHVILSWLKASGSDVPGSVYGWGAQKVNAGGVTTFSQHAVVSENRVTKSPPGLSARAAALLGCAVATGFGAVVHAAGVQPGGSVVVFGVGGVGLCAVAAAAAIGAGRIVAVDTRAPRLELAQRLGAHLCIHAPHESPLDVLRQNLPGGWDVAVEATGVPDVMKMALTAVRPRGGKAVVIGNAKFGEMLSIDPRELNQGKQLLGTWGGDTAPDRDFSIYSKWIISGQAPIEIILEREYSLAQINEALHDLMAGRVSRPLIRLTDDVR